MPQLWVTYQELADAFGGDAAEARAVSIARGWSRKRSRDGWSRVQLPDDLMLACFTDADTRAALVGAHHDTVVERLRGTLSRLVAQPTETPSRFS